jgi:hypothetical protein
MTALAAKRGMTKTASMPLIETRKIMMSWQRDASRHGNVRR